MKVGFVVVAARLRVVETLDRITDCLQDRIAAVIILVLDTPILTNINIIRNHVINKPKQA